MTRGQIAIITNEGIISSTEFNGGMYPRDDGYGLQIFSDIDDIESEQQYREYVHLFNRESGFGYEEELFRQCDESCFNMKDDYYEKWFSDYIYIKNLSDTAQTFIDSNGRYVRISPYGKAIFNYGELYASCDEDLNKRQLIDDLAELKENLSYDNQKSYFDIWNLCADYDNEYNDGLYLCDMIQEREFVTDEDLEHYIKEHATDISRLRHFINDTHEDDIYMFDGYGNLQNVDKEDFEGLIDDLIYRIQEDMKHRSKEISME